MVYNTYGQPPARGPDAALYVFNPALIHFSELTGIKLTSYDLRKNHLSFRQHIYV
jgi:hypothetical protein